MDKPHSKVLFPLEALGIGHASRGEIRAERLEDRHEPAIPFPHRHDFYQICFITVGRGWHEIDFTRHVVKAGSVFLMKPGQVHSWSLAKITSGFLVEFSHESLAAIAKSHINLAALTPELPDLIHVEKNASRDLEKLLSLMQTGFADKGAHAQAYLEGLLSAVIISCLRETPLNFEANSRIDRIGKFQQLVEENFRKQHRVGFYAEQLAITPKALTMQVSRDLRKSARAVIQDRLLLEAKRLLSFSNMNVAEVGSELGFEDANYFTRFFTQLADCTPTEFRRKKTQ